MIWMFRWSFLSRDQGSGDGLGLLDRGIKFNLALTKLMVKFSVGINFLLVKSVDFFLSCDENYNKRKISADKNYYQQSFYRVSPVWIFYLHVNSICRSNIRSWDTSSAVDWVFGLKILIWSADQLVNLEILIWSTDRIFNLEILVRSADPIVDLDTRFSLFDTFC